MVRSAFSRSLGPKRKYLGSRHVRLTLKSRHRQPAPACPFGATSRYGRTRKKL